MATLAQRGPMSSEESTTPSNSCDLTGGVAAVHRGLVGSSDPQAETGSAASNRLRRHFLRSAGPLPLGLGSGFPSAHHVAYPSLVLVHIAAQQGIGRLRFARGPLSPTPERGR